ADTSDTSTGSQTPRSSPPDTTTQPTEQTTTPAPTTSAEQTPPGVLVDPADYIGAESKDAKKELEGLGLSVDEEDVEGGDKDTVADVSPSGEVAPESAVTLFVYAGEDEDEDKGRGDEEPGKGKNDSRGKKKGKG
ncbi:MAG: PASTA domain-containing protein, partial [Actinomycetota bacterium]|nr:PASTA domain-containing protein [Actinomycetota bacterium]